MNSLVVINNTQVKSKEYKGQRVLTLQEIDLVHERPIGTAGRNFATNRERFIQDEDYFYIPYEELRSTNFVEHPNPKGLTLITESGYLMLAKSLNDDQAWRVQRQLVNTYFRAKEFAEKVIELSPQLQLLINMELEQKRMQQAITEAKQETAAVKQEVNEIREVIAVVPGENWRKETNALLNKVGKKLNDYKTPKEHVYKALEDRAKCKLNTRLGNLKERALQNGMAGSKVDALNFLDVIDEDVRLKEIYIAIVKEIAIKNGISVD